MEKHPKKTLNPQVFDEAIFEWRAPEYLHHEKSLVWFVIAGLAALGLIIYGLMTDGWTFSVAIAVFAGTYYLFHHTTPPVVTIKISKMGVKIGHHIFPYSHIKGFWIVYDPPFVAKIYFKMTSKMHPDIFVALEDADPAELRRILSTHCKELAGYNEPLADSLVRLLRL